MNRTPLEPNHHRNRDEDWTKPAPSTAGAWGWYALAVVGAFALAMVLSGVTS
jgi:hypothetical protein